MQSADIDREARDSLFFHIESPINHVHHVHQMILGNLLPQDTKLLIHNYGGHGGQVMFWAEIITYKAPNTLIKH